MIVYTATSLQLWSNCQYGRFQLAVTSCVSMAEFCGLDLGPNFGRHPLGFIEYEVKKTPAQSISEFRGLMLARPDIGNPNLKPGQVADPCFQTFWIIPMNSSSDF